MKLNPVPFEVAKAGLRTVKTVCLAGNEGAQLTDLQADLIRGIQKYIVNVEIPLEDLTVISPMELALVVEEKEFRERILRSCIIAACIEGDMNANALRKLGEFASLFHVDMAPLSAAWELAKQNLLMARVAIVRKSLPGFKIKQTLKNEGLLALVKQFFPLLGMELPELTAKYRKLEKYPEGSLGREFINYLQKNSFSLPGEKGAGPEIIVLHDCLHILGGYGTSATEEIEVASFQAGCHSNDPIYGLLFGLAQYHLNVQMAPVAPSQKLQANPERMVAAFARGCKVNRDMWADFNPWEHFGQQVSTLRAELGISLEKYKIETISQ